MKQYKPAIIILSITIILIITAMAFAGDNVLVGVRSDLDTNKKRAIVEFLEALIPGTNAVSPVVYTNTAGAKWYIDCFWKAHLVTVETNKLTPEKIQWILDEVDDSQKVKIVQTDNPVQTLQDYGLMRKE